jgi:VWFA-related protein
MRTAAFAVIGCLAGVIAGVDARQTAPQEPQRPPTFRATVEIAQVDVSVLDGNRRPVRGLRAADFTLLENGRPQEIVGFTAIDVPEFEAPPASWSRTVVPDVRVNDLGDGRLFAIVMDDATMPPDLRMADNARKIGRSVINRLGPADLAAVIFTIDSRRSVDFTNDRARLLAAIDGFQPGFAYSDQVFGTDSLHFLTSIRSLGKLSALLASVPQRRKAVIYVSTGVPVNPEVAASFIELGPSGPPAMGDPIDGGTLVEDTAREILAAVSDVLTTRPQQAYGAAMQEAFIRAQHGNVNIYCIDPSGSGGLQYYLQQRVSRDVNGAPRMTPVEAIQESRLHKSFLQTLASNSGGRAIVDTNDLEGGLTQIFRENSTYYLLAYRPVRAPGDRSVRKVTVRVNRPGVTAQTRNAYYNPNASPAPLPATIPLRLTGALSGILPNPDIYLRTAVAPFATPGRREAGVAIILGIRPASGGDPGDRIEEPIEIQARAFTAAGEERASIRHQARVVSRAGVRNAEFEILTRLDLQPGRYQLRIAAFSHRLNKSGSVYYDVDVPDFQDVPLSLSGVVLSLTPPPPMAPAEGLPALMPVMPTSLREFDATDNVRAFFRVYQGGGGRLSPVTLTSQITKIDDTVGDRVREVLGAERFGEGRAAPHTVELPLTNLAPGSYMLTIEAAMGNRTAKRDVRFQIR